jgi:hypothetical protein
MEGVSGPTSGDDCSHGFLHRSGLDNQGLTRLSVTHDLFGSISNWRKLADDSMWSQCNKNPATDSGRFFEILIAPAEDLSLRAVWTPPAH